MKKVGIDDMALYVPKLYLDIQDLASVRGLEFAKLNKGLGLNKMAITDAHEDAATMAANAVLELIEKNQINPKNIGRLYMGTESALDGAKPTATYTLEMLRQKLTPKFGENCLLHCDVIDMTFACIGAVDAMHNTLDWIKGGENRLGIVVSSDIAKYDLNSSGEYTQGAGAIAVLIKEEPRLIAIGEPWGVATRGVHDFFKPRRKSSQEALIDEILTLAGIEKNQKEAYLNQIRENAAQHQILDPNEKNIAIHKETPVFDGQFSNDCYQKRIVEAFEHFKAQAESNENESFVNTWERLVFHLPYAFHGQRMFPELFASELNRIGKIAAILENNDLALPKPEDFDSDNAYQAAIATFYKNISKTPEYKAYVNQKIAKGQFFSSEIGNMYTGSIFLSLIGTLERDYLDKSNIEGSKFGFFAYGSGSKSKVFEGEIQPNWKEVTARFKVSEKVENRQAVDYNTYFALHTGNLETSHAKPQQEFALVEITKGGGLEGVRVYEWVG